MQKRKKFSIKKEIHQTIGGLCADNLAVSYPEATTAIRHFCMEPLKIAKYFTVLKSELDKIMGEHKYITNESMEHERNRVTT